MTETNILDLDDIFVLCETYRLSDKEIKRINHIYAGAELTDEQLYDAGLTILKTRAKSDIRVNDSIEILVSLAADEGYTLEQPSEIVPSIGIMMIGGSI